MGLLSSTAVYLRHRTAYANFRGRLYGFRVNGAENILHSGVQPSPPHACALHNHAASCMAPAAFLLSDPVPCTPISAKRARATGIVEPVLLFTLGAVALTLPGDMASLAPPEMYKYGVFPDPTESIQDLLLLPIPQWPPLLRLSSTPTTVATALPAPPARLAAAARSATSARSKWSCY